MGTKYKIRDGFTMREADGTIKAGGQTVVLEQDVYKAHAHKLEPIASAPRAPKAPAGGADGQ